MALCVALAWVVVVVTVLLLQLLLLPLPSTFASCQSFGYDFFGLFVYSGGPRRIELGSHFIVVQLYQDRRSQARARIQSFEIIDFKHKVKEMVEQPSSGAVV